MMKNIVLTAVSLPIIMMASPAISQTYDTQNPDKPFVETTNEAEIKENWEATKDAASEAWGDTKKAVSNTAESVSETTQEIVDDVAAKLDTKIDVRDYVENRNDITAKNVVGKPLYDQKGQKLGLIKDIVVSRNGVLKGIIVQHGGFMGLGSKKIMVGLESFQNKKYKNGFSIAMTKQNMSTYPEFYSTNPAHDLLLTSEIINSNIVDNTMQNIAKVNYMIITNGNIDKLIITYVDGILTKFAVIDFSDAEIVVNKGPRIVFKLSEAESEQLKNYMNYL
jgi:sporulation protein YlmC with PRC-barrel domain